MQPRAMESPCKSNRPGPQGSSGANKQGKYKTMNEKNLENKQRLERDIKVPAKPNESGRLEVQDHVRIYDPNTQETLLEKRA